MIFPPMPMIMKLMAVIAISVPDMRSWRRITRYAWISVDRSTRRVPAMKNSWLKTNDNELTVCMATSFVMVNDPFYPIR